MFIRRKTGKPPNKESPSGDTIQSSFTRPHSLSLSPSPSLSRAPNPTSVQCPSSHAPLVSNGHRFQQSNPLSSCKRGRGRKREGGRGRERESNESFHLKKKFLAFVETEVKKRSPWPPLEMVQLPNLELNVL